MVRPALRDIEYETVGKIRRLCEVSVELQISILDQSPVSDGSTPGDALQRSVELARLGDRLGYRRFWMSEHHAMQTLACTAPEIMLARLGAETTRIRLGSGGIMLPHYAALKVAEQFSTLEALYPGRIDLGLGRAPGGGPVESLALRRERRVQPADDFADQLGELLAFLDDSFPQSHPFGRIRVEPASMGTPDVWLLGSSLWSASAAAEFGLPYAFAHFFSPLPTRQAIESYRRSFVPGARRAEPEATVAVGVIVAPSAEEAEFLASSVRLLQRRIRQGDRRPVASPEQAMQELRGAFPLHAGEEGEWPRLVAGTAETVREKLESMAAALDLHEILVNTIVWDHAARMRSYELLAEVMQIPAEEPLAERPRGRAYAVAGLAERSMSSSL